MKRLLSVAACCLLLIAPAAAQSLQPVKIGALRLGGVAPLFIAIDKGYFSDQGLDAQFVDFTGSTQLPPAVVSGSVDFALVAYTAAFFNLAGKGGLKVVASQSREQPGFEATGYLITTKAWDAGFHTLKDLRGKRIGLTGFGSSTQYAAEIAARKYGIDRKSFTEISLGSVPNVMAAAKGGQIDLAMLNALALKQLEKDGAGRVIAWQGDVEPTDYGGIFTTPEIIARNRPMVAKVVRAYQRGAATFSAAFNKLDAQGHLVKGPGYDELLALLVRDLRQPPELVAASLPYVDPEARLDVKNIEKQVALWKSLGMVDKDADPAKMLDLSFVKTLDAVN